MQGAHLSFRRLACDRSAARMIFPIQERGLPTWIWKSSEGL